MRRYLPVFLSLLLFPCLVHGQRWNAAEQEVLDHVEKCWDAWKQTVDEKDLGTWKEVCQPSADITSLDTSSDVLWSLEFQSRHFNEWVKNVERYWWQGIQPLEIKIYDDTALIWFFVTFSVEDTAGIVNRIQQKRFEVMQRYDGGWHWVGAMVFPEEIGSPFEVKK